MLVIFRGKIAAGHLFNVLLVFFLLHPLISFSQSKSTKREEWHLRKNENGIRIYTRNSVKSAVDEMKVVSIVHASLSSIVAVILDVNNYPEWVYGCRQGKILQQVNATEQYQYQVTDMPPPFTDRDAVIHFTLWQDPVSKIVYTKSEAAPEYFPPKSGLVRLPMFDASYELRPLGKGDVQVIYFLALDPGGNIPDWLVNWTIVTGPFQSISKMHQQVKRSQYASSKLNFIKEP